MDPEGVAGNLVASGEEPGTTVSASASGPAETAGGPVTAGVPQAAQRPSSKNLAPPHVEQVMMPAIQRFAEKPAPL